MIGYFGNGILFFRFGEILKAYSISQGNKITASESFGIIMLERVIDALTVLILLLMFLPWMPIQNITINYWVSAFAVVTVLFTLIILILRKINWKNFITSLSFINESFRSLLVSMME